MVYLSIQVAAVFLLFPKGSSATRINSNHLFTCDDGTSISRARSCDDKWDCPNGEDETNEKAWCWYYSCRSRNTQRALVNGYTCRKPCHVSESQPCRAPNKQCVCDDECGYSCINPDASCTDSVPMIRHAIGHKVIRSNSTERIIVSNPSDYKYHDMIIYECKPGMKLVGLLPRCGGNKKWTTTQLPRCQDITCKTPVPQVQGSYSHQYVRWHGNEFRPLGIGEPPVVNDVIVYVCDAGMIPMGIPPKCGQDLQWTSGNVSCEDPCLQASTVDFGALIRSLLRGPVWRHSSECPTPINLEPEQHNIHFLIDVSESVVRRGYLKDHIEFAKRFVQTMKGFNFFDVIFGIQIFPTTKTLVLDVTTQDRFVTSDAITRILDAIYANASRGDYRSQQQSGWGTSVGHPLSETHRIISFMQALSRMHYGDKNMRNHVFVFTDGKLNEDGLHIPSMLVHEFGSQIEFYSVTTCEICISENHYELMALDPRGENNIILIKDFYKRTKFMNALRDFSSCGVAGNSGPMGHGVSLQRVAGGHAAAEGAWPWQVLITVYPRNIKLSAFDDDLMQGGGSILSEHWVLTAAHLFGAEGNIASNYLVSAGVNERPEPGHHVGNSVQMFSPDQIFIHPNYSSATFDSDIALIRLGSRVDPSSLARLKQVPSGFVFTQYIRPICLPCTNSCRKRRQFVDEDGNNLFTDGMSAEEQCRIESGLSRCFPNSVQDPKTRECEDPSESMLFGDSARAIVTGFGHYNESSVMLRRVKIARRMQQAILQLSSQASCQQGIEKLKRLGVRGIRELFFTENMFCSDTVRSDACKGDSGGPVVRQILSNEENAKACWVQIGIVSFGYGCRSGDIPGYYTNVAKFMQWITQVTGM